MHQLRGFSLVSLVRGFASKATILLTDGVDHGSMVSHDRALENAQRPDTLIYSICFEGEEGGGFRRTPGLEDYVCLPSVLPPKGPAPEGERGPNRVVPFGGAKNVG